MRNEVVEAVVENHDGRLGRNRKPVVVVPDKKPPFLIRESDLLIFQHGSVEIAKNRQQHLLRQFPFDRMPIDVEQIGEAGTGAVLQHVQPPGVGRLPDAHVVRNHIEDVTHVMSLKRPDELAVLFLGSEFRIQDGGVYDVVPVHAARDRFEIGRSVAVRHTQRVQVGNDPGRIGEREQPIELDPIGCAGQRRHTVRLRHMSLLSCCGRMGRSPIDDPRGSTTSPLLVTWNRFLSAAWSHPSSVPAGMTLNRSAMTRLSLALEPIRTPSRITHSSIWAPASMWTFRPITDRRMSASITWLPCPTIASSMRDRTMLAVGPSKVSVRIGQDGFRKSKIGSSPRRSKWDCQYESRVPTSRQYPRSS